MQLKPNSLLQGGKYRIICVLGQGGFGITYEAEQVNLGRKVALKEFFIKDYCNRDPKTSQVSVPSTGGVELVARFREKFLKEARLIASLNHPNIVKIHDVFEENGTAYYVMEFLSGGSLADKCVDGEPLPESEALGYVRQIASALHYLHTLPTPMNHLDIKPSNVMMNDTDLAILIDFGISKRYDETGGQTSSTPVGISRGYSPLEQYREGGVSVFSPMTDIYSLGATLYKLVTGATPPQASDILIDGLPDLPSSLSPSVGKAISAAMQPSPKSRPKSVSEFLSILDEISSPATPAKEIPRPKKPDVKKDETVIQKVDEGSYNGHEWVDLGLPSGLKWATMNVGASSPQEFGDFFAWGETEPKQVYDSTSYKFQEWINWLGVIKKYSKYCTLAKFGKVDDINRLDPEDDAARVQWGGKWRMPTLDEINELLNPGNCTWRWTAQKGKNGYLVTSIRDGNSIFLPAAGYCDGKTHDSDGTYGGYKSSSLVENLPDNAYTLYFSPGNEDASFCLRQYGQSVRPVAD